jgi:hypothetical protein
LENGVVVDTIFPYQSAPAILTGYEKLSELLLEKIITNQYHIAFDRSLHIAAGWSS